MIRWEDDAILLAARPHGEGKAVVQLLTRSRGRHAGLVHGAARARALLQPGNEVAAAWQARLAEHLGSLTLEPVRNNAARWLDDPDRLAAVSAATALAETALPEREPHPATFEGLTALLACLDGPLWSVAYVGWELGLLADLGYGLDLARCAVTGTSEDLAWVSPRTGRAVSRAAGEPYRDRLLPLPGFLVGTGDADPPALGLGLALTGHFLETHVLALVGRPLPGARQRLVERLAGERLHPSAAAPGAQ